MKEAFINVAGMLVEVGIGVTTIFLFKMAVVSKSALGRFAGKLDAGTRGITNKAKEYGESRNFYQRRQLARDARKQEQRRANVADYATQITGDDWRSRQLRRRAAGGLAGQLLNTNQAGQERQRLNSVGQLERFEHEETQQAAGLIESNRITNPGQLQALAAGGVGRGVDGRTISAQGNQALQRAALQKLIDAQDAEQLENLFMNRTNVVKDPAGNVVSFDQGNVDQAMLIGELQKGKNYSTTKGAGAHLVSMHGKRDANNNFVPYTQTEVQDAAASAMSKLASDKLAQQDGPSWQSAHASFSRAAASGASLTERQALWDRVDAIKSDKRADAMIKGSARAAYDAIHAAGKPTI